MPKADTIHLGENKKTADLRRIFLREPSIYPA